MEVIKEYAILSLLLILVLISVIMLLVAPLYRDRQKRSGRGLPYLLRTDFFSPAEQLFFNALQESVAGRWWVFPKVRLDDILGARQDMDRLAYHGARKRIRARHVDFLICEPVTFRFIAAIELDEPQNHFPDRVEAEVNLDQIFLQAGLPFLHFPEKNSYNPQELQADLDAKLLAWPARP